MSDPNRYLALVRSRTVFKDGAMGTQIQDAELDDAALRRLPGQRRPPDAVARPTSIRDIHRAYLDAGADYVDHELVPVDRGSGSRSGGWASARSSINRAAAALARAVARRVRDRRTGRASWPARSGPTGMLPSGNDPTLSAITLRRARRAVPRAGHRAARGRRRPAADRDACRTSSRRARPSPAPGAPSPRPAGAVPLQVQVALDVTGRMLLGTDIGAVAAILARHAGRRHRPELLRRPRAPARAGALPVPGRATCRLGDPERRPAAERRRRGRLPARARPRWPSSWRRSCTTRAPTSSAAAAARRPSTSASCVEAVGAAPREAAPARCSEPRDRARAHDGRRRSPGAAAADRRRARQHAGLAQDQGAAAGRRLRRRAAGRARPGRGRRARARRLRGADRARRRGRPDGDRRQEAGDGRRGAADDRHARDRRADARRSRRIPAAPSSTRSTWRTGATGSRQYVPLMRRARRGGRRADDRRGGHGEDARARSCASRARSTTSAWTSTAWRRRT